VSVIRKLLADIVEMVKAPIRNLMEKEPTRVVTAVGVAVTAGVAWLGAQLGIVIPESLVPWVVIVVGGAIAEAIRRFVYAPATVQAIANEATNLPPGSEADIGKPPDASPPLAEGGQG